MLKMFNLLWGNTYLPFQIWHPGNRAIFEIIGDLEINDVDELLDDDDEADLDDIQRNHRYANMPTSLLAGLNGIGKL